MPRIGKALHSAPELTDVSADDALEADEPNFKLVRELPLTVHQIVYTRTRSIDVPRELLRASRIVSGFDQCLFTDAYKILSTQVSQKLRMNEWSTLGVTSPGSGEGKTLTAINLAISLASEFNQTALLVDADLRRPSVGEYFGLQPGPGLSDYLMSNTPIDELLVHPDVPGFVFLPGGTPLVNSSEALGWRRMATRPDLIFLGLDERSLVPPPFSPAELENNRAFQLITQHPPPWSREVWAILLDRVCGAGARLVIFDMVFDSPKDGDDAFAAALAKYRDRVVLAANIDAFHDNQILWPNSILIPPPAEVDHRVGYANFWKDPIDNIMRATSFSTSDRQLAGLPSFPGEQVYQSMVARGLEQLGRGPDVPRDQRGHLLRFSAANAYPPRTLYEVFDPKFWRANYGNGAFFKDKVIVVGAAAQSMHDFVSTPLDTDTPGPALHLQVMAAALAHEFLHPTPPLWMFALVGAGGVCAWLLVAFVRRPLLCLFGLIAAAAGYLIVARLVYDQLGFLLLTVPPLSAFLLSGALSLGFEYVLESIEKLRTRRTLERYVSKNLVKEILDNPNSFYANLKGVRIPATVLFSDIVGFTSLTEHADPEALVRQLNEYLSRMTSTVFEYGGTLDKFIGDAVMAVWGNVSSRGAAEDARMAARSALAMRRELRKLNLAWHAQGVAPFAIGVGINQGDVLCGNIGSQEKADPTVIGDAVNLASRLEALTRTYGVDIILGPTATQFAREEFLVRSIARVLVKGKTDPVEISWLIASRNDPIDPEFVRHLETYEEGFLKFRNRDFHDAKILLSRFLEFYPNDHLAKLYLQRVLEYETAPPDEAWNAVEVFEKK